MPAKKPELTTPDECLYGMYEQWEVMLNDAKTKEELAQNSPLLLGFIVSTHLAHIATFRQKRITQAEFDKCVNESLLDVCWELIQKARAGDLNLDDVELS